MLKAPMHEEYYGFAEKPFSLTPDPRYLFKGESHGKAFDLLRSAVQRGQGFVVITGDVGTGKTMLCRAVLEELDERTCTALVLNPFISEEDLLRQMLQDFGVVSRDEMRRGRLASVGRQELFDTLHEFLLTLVPLRAGAILAVDEAQDLPLPVLELIRVLSNLETNTQKLLQVVLVGQPTLKEVLRSPELRLLDQRISVRHELQPLNRTDTASYVAHRLAVAGGASTVSFTPKALDLVFLHSRGVPRLINQLCDRALAGGASARSKTITPAMVTAAAEGLEMVPVRRSPSSSPVRTAALLAGGILLGAAATAAFLGYAGMRAGDGAARTEGAQASRAPLTATPGDQAASQQQPPGTPAQQSQAGQQATTPQGQQPSTPAPAAAPPTAEPPPPTTAPPAQAPRRRYSVLVASFRQPSEAEMLRDQFASEGLEARVSRVQSATSGFWYQVLVGPYPDESSAGEAQARLRRLPAYGDARVVPR